MQLQQKNIIWQVLQLSPIFILVGTSLAVLAMESESQHQPHEQVMNT